MLMMLNKTGSRVQSRTFSNGHHIVPRDKDNEPVITIKIKLQINSMKE